MVTKKTTSRGYAKPVVKRAAVQPKRGAKGASSEKPRARATVTPPLPPERPVPHTEGLQVVGICEASSPRNTKLRKQHPDIDVVDLPDVYFLAMGGNPPPGAPFRLSVPGVGTIIVDVELGTLATEGELARAAVDGAASARLRAERHASRFTGVAAWRWVRPRPERPLGKAEETFLRWLVKRAIDRMRDERRNDARSSPSAT